MYCQNHLRNTINQLIKSQVNFYLRRFHAINTQMKQNQQLFRPIPGEKTTLKHHDFLNQLSTCQCTPCSSANDPINPEIYIDYDLIKLQRNKNTLPRQQSDLIMFFRKLKDSNKGLPQCQFVDTIVMKSGLPEFAIYFEEKIKVIEYLNLKSFILRRKQEIDLLYQKKKHTRSKPGFMFAQFDHESEKLIKQFQKKIKYTNSLLNRIVIVKIAKDSQERILTKSQFLDFFDITKNKYCDLAQIQYFQIFPIMYGEQQSSYIKSIKYFREGEQKKRLFKLAEAYMTHWLEKNESIEKLEQQVFEQLHEKDSSEGMISSQEQRLMYQTYKLFSYFESTTNLRILEARVHYITTDCGISFAFKNIECLKIEQKKQIHQIDIKLPTYKDIGVQNYIDLKSEMKKSFSNFQVQFDRLDKERMQMQNKAKKDKQYSNYVFKMINKRNSDNFHEILQSNNIKYKRKQLQL